MQEPPEPIPLDYAGRRPGRIGRLCQSGQDSITRGKGLRFWAFVTLFLYAAAIIGIFIPLTASLLSPTKPEETAKDAINAFAEWWFWAFIGIMVAAQLLLLLVPVRAAWDYEIKPRRLIVPVATACALLAILLGGVITSVFAAIWGDDTPPALIISAMVVTGGSWLLWWLVFRRYTRSSPDEAMDGIAAVLVRGSIVELLVAVSCHIWVRQRGDCSAPGFTFAAICAGFSIMLCAFGPGVFCLLVARARRMQSKSKIAAAQVRDKA